MLPFICRHTESGTGYEPNVYIYLNPKTYILKAKRLNLNPKPSALNPQPEPDVYIYLNPILKPKTYILKAKRLNLNPKPSTLNPDP